MTPSFCPPLRFAAVCVPTNFGPITDTSPDHDRGGCAKNLQHPSLSKPPECVQDKATMSMIFEVSFTAKVGPARKCARMNFDPHIWRWPHLRPWTRQHCRTVCGAHALRAAPAVARGGARGSSGQRPAADARSRTQAEPRGPSYAVCTGAATTGAATTRSPRAPWARHGGPAP